MEAQRPRTRSCVQDVIRIYSYGEYYDNVLIPAQSLVDSAAKMKFSLAALALPIAAQAAHYSSAEYAFGAIHQKLMKLKNDQWEHDAAEAKQDPPWGGGKDNRVRCKNGLAIVEQGNANQNFRCNNASFTGAAFVEILRDAQSEVSRWRETRVLNDCVIIGSEAVGHNVQIFNMKNILTVDPKSPKTELVGLWDEPPIGRSQNVVVDWDNDLQYIDLSNPSKTTSPGWASRDGYKDGNPASEVLSRLSYPGATYCHQGWWTERNWHQYVHLTDLRNPKATGTFYATDSKEIDHNLYILDGLAYQSYYGAGIWFHDLASGRGAGRGPGFGGKSKGKDN
ncbi:hypothetical protein EJ02DRAFT_500168 [Clathrospora elynae]|uniref:Uncharacterized protein n=1 Tax=Clathrospora elynae TaxID=706981 RepID=A0A6A5T299_9PLEO|nr:hypothetical protein EJ02DRAFT_500168 [Clathrospora elynae]